MPGTVVLNQVPIEIVNEDGDKVIVNSDGNLYAVSIRDEEQLSLLYKVYKEMKKMNFYLSQLVDQELEDQDMEED